jgi:hypothetical protein
MKQFVAVGIPAIGLCILSAMYVVIPLVCGGGFDGVMFCLGTITIFTVSMAIWLPLAFTSYGMGYFLFRRYIKTSSGVALLILSEAVMCVPLYITALLFIVGKYHGP